MKNTLLILVLLFMSGCVERSNLYDPSSPNYDEELANPTMNQVILEEISMSGDTAVLLLSIKNMEPSVGVIHAVFNENITIEDVEILHFPNTTNALFKGNLLDIISTEHTITGDKAIASIKATGKTTPLSFNTPASECIDIFDKKIESINWNPSNQ